ncbi:LrgB family protein [Oribacterium sp. NK2B42]|uniref:LrgB family protein n=1 Tax=Oribacterium sp. NK2B42 TaxID=689781 RepID=UPI0004204CC9|nr:LrgB family protein [Oribacterium sp. NK2B42]
MKETLISAVAGSDYFGLFLSIGLFIIALKLKARFKFAILNPLLVSTVLCIIVLVVLDIPYETYRDSAKMLSYLLTPATVCLAVPMYKQLKLLKDNLAAVAIGIMTGTCCSILSILAMGKLFGLTDDHIATLLPKSITTAIGMGVSEEAGGIVTLTVAAIIITGILGNMIAENIFEIFHIEHPVAKGLALGTSAHAVGTAKALELGEVEGAMSSLSICVAGILTVILVPLVSGTLLW